jgi:outer membrane lipoprotein carrier protein
VNGAARAPVLYNVTMRSTTALFVAALAAASARVGAPTGPAAAAHALARKVQGHYFETRDLACRFTQTYTYAGLGRRQVSRGRLLVKKPGRMRWDYEEPARKTIAVVGSRLVQFEPEANQAYVDERFDSTAMSAAVTFLLGRGDLEKEFEISAGDGGSLVLVPKKPDPRVESVTLTVGAAGEVVATRVVDGSGNANEIAFSSLRRNTGLADADFEVKLPKDVHRVEAPGASR